MNTLLILLLGAAAWIALLNIVFSRATMGYEDDGGFHYGKEPQTH